MQIIRKIYDWLLLEAEKPWARRTLFAVAFIESSVFPIPPDAMLLPMALADRARAYQLALICTIGSVFGGLLGYAIGYYFYETIGQAIMKFYHAESAYQNFHDGFNKWGVWIILIKGVIFFIPYKLITIASGIAHFPLIPFVLSSMVTRAARFYLVAFLAHRYGPPIKTFIEKYLNWVVLAFFLLIAAGFALVMI